MPSLTLHRDGKVDSYPFHEGVNLAELLRNLGCFLDAPCGGHGTCGKCNVTLKTAGTEQTVLACQTVLSADSEVWLASAENLSQTGTTDKSNLKNDQGATPRASYGIAVDLGTTTLVMGLYHLLTGEQEDILTQWNRQRAFGADVLTRIEACMQNKDGLARLRDAVLGQMGEMLTTLCNRNGIAVSDVSIGFVAGNTVMEHILYGIAPDSIAAAPYKPLSYFDGNEKTDLMGIPLYIAPCVAGYVGGDIIAGLLSLEETGQTPQGGEQALLFIDVGTNGEIVLQTANGYTACAVACGPAFEGANIACGMGATLGAVRHVTRTDEGLIYETVGGGEPKGLCGSGLIDLAACLTELGYIDESGRLENEDGDPVFRLTEDVYIDGRDVRQLQLAKAAVCAGIRRLTEYCGIPYEAIGTVCLAGSFGAGLNVESAVKIGMLPKALAGKIRAVGNTALQGAALALTNPGKRWQLTDIKARCRYLELSTDTDFSDLFVDAMEFCEQ